MEIESLLHAYDASLERDGCSLGSILGAKFGEDVLQVEFHGGEGYVQGGDDFLVAVAGCHKFQDIQFAGGQISLLPACHKFFLQSLADSTKLWNLPSWVKFCKKIFLHLKIERMRLSVV